MLDQDPNQTLALNSTVNLANSRGLKQLTLNNTVTSLFKQAKILTISVLAKIGKDY